MGVALRVGDRLFEIGSPSFFNSFFSTVAVRAEDGQWGASFPAVMRGLYSGRVDAATADAAVAELDAIREALSSQAPDRVVWDFHDPGARPPWGDNISSAITSLGNYFVTSEGRDLIDALREGLTLSAETRTDAVVE